ncbi:hypothetical protein BLOT_016849 [Blomia tropicalis]|nr:hypothetical protein BLOT_016849 [Blomia tropicalis]
MIEEDMNIDPPECESVFERDDQAPFFSNFYDLVDEEREFFLRWWKYCLMPERQVHYHFKNLLLWWVHYLISFSKNTKVASVFSRSLISNILNFTNKEKLHNSYLNDTGLYVKPIPIKKDGINVAQYISPKKLSTIILRNPSIVQSIIEEQSESSENDEPFETYNSELTCCVSRRKELLGKLRIELSNDDFP